jgi:hypothetical protein
MKKVKLFAAKKVLEIYLRRIPDLRVRLKTLYDIEEKLSILKSKYEDELNSSLSQSG